jgi:hypothetical protein
MEESFLKEKWRVVGTCIIASRKEGPVKQSSFEI